MSEHGGHDHGLASYGTAASSHRGRLLAVLVITCAVFVVQIIGALVSGSLALFADAGHMLTDATGVLIALVAVRIAARPATARRTFGFQRAEVLAALANGVALVVIAVIVFTEAIARIGSTIEVASGPMLFAAVVGGVANVASLLVLRGGRKASINIRGAYLEVLGDLLGSIAVVVAAIVILTTGWTGADQWASILISLLILPRAWSLLREVVEVLMEATPRGVDLDEARRHLLETPGVVDVHDLHAWTITSGVPVFSAHVIVADTVLLDRGGDHMLDTLVHCLGEHFDLAHCTLQLEPAEHAAHEADDALHR
jgi:cobalt-zinc-cadmium efflux system protein